MNDLINDIKQEIKLFTDDLKQLSEEYPMKQHRWTSLNCPIEKILKKWNLTEKNRNTSFRIKKVEYEFSFKEIEKGNEQGD